MITTALSSMAGDDPDAARLRAQLAAEPGPSARATVTENETHLALHNRHLTLIFAKDSGSLAGIWNAAGEWLVRPTRHSRTNALWTITLAGQPTPGRVRRPADFPQLTVHQESTRAGRGLAFHHSDSAGSRVVARVFLEHDAPTTLWNIEARAGRDASLWQVEYPILPVAPLGGDAPANRLVQAYRHGRLHADPFLTKTTARGWIAQTSRYPSANGGMQFLALYNDTTRAGLYFATEDPAAHQKEFNFDAQPSAGLLQLSVTHLPAGRGGKLTSYRAPYAVRLQAYTGGWYEAARLYRSWVLRQPWFAKGPLFQRRDMPAWLTAAPVIARVTGAELVAEPDAARAASTLARIGTALARLRAELGASFPVLIYNWRQFDRTRAAHPEPDCLAHGGRCDVPRLDGLPSFAGQLVAADLRPIIYLNARVFDQAYAPAENPAAATAVARDRAGAPTLYSPALPLWSMCLTTDWWQRRYRDIARASVRDLQAAGVYLDSFGRGSPECFATDHPHPPGGGNVAVQGQRAFAARVKRELRRQRPELVLLSEACTESYADLIDLNLLSVDYYEGYLPLRRAVYGDYMLAHGRGNKRRLEDLRFRTEVSTLFLEGALIGRLEVTEDGAVLEQDADRLAWVKQLAAFTRHGLDYLRFGQLLAPPAFAAGPMLSYSPDPGAARPVLIEAPAVAAGCYRSPRDGSVAVVFVNRDNQPHSFAFTFRAESPQARHTRLLTLGADGARAVVAEFVEAHTQSVTVPPGGVQFFISESETPRQAGGMRR